MALRIPYFSRYDDRAKLLQDAGVVGAKQAKALARACERSPYCAGVVHSVIEWSKKRRSLECADWPERIELIRQEYKVSDKILVGLFHEGEFETGHDVWGLIGSRRELREVVSHSKTRRWCRLLFEVTNGIAAKTVLELGTCVGISTAYLAAAVHVRSGNVVTLEGSKDFSEQADITLSRLGLGKFATFHTGLIQDRLLDVLKSETLFDLVFIDAHHDGLATLRYLDAILPRLAPQAVVIVDDIRWSDGMLRAWRQIQQDTRIPLTIDLDGLGLCVIAPGLRKLHVVWTPPQLGSATRQDDPVAIDHPARPA